MVEMLAMEETEAMGATGAMQVTTNEVVIMPQEVKAGMEPMAGTEAMVEMGGMEVLFILNIAAPISTILSRLLPKEETEAMQVWEETGAWEAMGAATMMALFSLLVKTELLEALDKEAMVGKEVIRFK